MFSCTNGHDILVASSVSGCAECDRISSRQYYNNNKEIIKKKKKAWTENRKEQQRQSIRKYHKIRKEQILNYRKQRLILNLNVKLRERLRNRLYQALKDNYKSGSAVRDLGCSISELKEHLEKQFKPGMNWSDWGNGKGNWNIDHIIPLARFDLTNRKQFLKAVNCKNLQPLWFEENMKKGRLV